jgi:hypothetical protein
MLRLLRRWPGSFHQPGDGGGKRRICRSLHKPNMQLPRSGDGTDLKLGSGVTGMRQDDLADFTSRNATNGGNLNGCASG